MATTFEFRVSCEPARVALAERALGDAHGIVARLELELSEFHPDSPIRRLNESKLGERVALPRSAILLLEQSEKLRLDTAGSFDCTVKSQGGEPGSRVSWNSAAREAWKLHPGAHVGFGAIGKGHALDEARLLLESLGFHDFLLSAGGSSIIVSGFAGPGTAWTWGWSWARDQDGDSVGLPYRHLDGSPIAIGVSGTHEQGLHIMKGDLKGGAAAADGLLSALVAHSSAAEADALSTALFVSGWQQGLPALDQAASSPPAAAVIERSGEFRWNGIFQKLWGPATGIALLLAAGLGAQSSSFAAVVVKHAPRTGQIASPKAGSAGGAISNEASSAGGASNEASSAGGAISNEASSAGGASNEASSAGGASNEEALDLSAMVADTFTPYITERNPAWALLPAFMICMILLHLRKYRVPSKSPKQIT